MRRTVDDAVMPLVRTCSAIPFWRSITSVASPAAAVSRATESPAGPAPTTSTSTRSISDCPDVRRWKSGAADLNEEEESLGWRIDPRPNFGELLQVVPDGDCRARQRGVAA